MTFLVHRLLLNSATVEKLKNLSLSYSCSLDDPAPPDFLCIFLGTIVAVFALLEKIEERSDISVWMKRGVG